jgi:hypothetical protein
MPRSIGFPVEPNAPDSNGVAQKREIGFDVTDNGKPNDAPWAVTLRMLERPAWTVTLVTL